MVYDQERALGGEGALGVLEQPQAIKALQKFSDSFHLYDAEMLCCSENTYFATGEHPAAVHAALRTLENCQRIETLHRRRAPTDATFCMHKKIAVNILLPRPIYLPSLPCRESASKGVPFMLLVQTA